MSALTPPTLTPPTLTPPTVSAPQGAPLLEVSHLTKSFVLHAIDGRRVDGLVGVDLTVFPGEHVALAGPSGAGKSTLLKCVYRTYLPSAGRIMLRTHHDGVHAGDDGYVDLAAADEQTVLRVRHSHLGYVSQFLRAEQRRGVHEAVTRVATRRGVDAAEASDAAATALRRLRIDERLWRTYPTLLSGGEKQRVNLAAGLVAPPQLLLLDEPISALDPDNVDAVLSIIEELPERGVTVVSVFHQPDAIRRLATRVVVIDNGTVVRSGRPDQILDEQESLC